MLPHSGRPAKAEYEFASSIGDARAPRGGPVRQLNGPRADRPKEGVLANSGVRRVTYALSARRQPRSARAAASLSINNQLGPFMFQEGTMQRRQVLFSAVALVLA